MKIIGLCGGSGSGKSEVCSFVISLGIPVIDADAVYHEITSKEGQCLEQLRLEFGDEIISCGALDRKALSKIVFESGEPKKIFARLNSITHPYVLSSIEDSLRKYECEGKEFCFVDIPLLFESGFDERCDYTVAVLADTEIRISRIVERDKITEENAKARIESQIDNETLRPLTDYQLINNSDKEKLRRSVSELLEKIR